MRFLFDYFLGVFVYVLLIALCEFSFYFYPLAMILIGSLYFRLALIGHEATHGLIYKNRVINDLAGRYLCYFPIMSSLSRYRFLHMLHHRSAGEELDFDWEIYNVKQRTLFQYLWYELKRVLSGIVLLNFLTYFSDLGGIYYSLRRGRVDDVKAIFWKSDFKQFLVFWALVIFLLSYFQLWSYYFWYYFLPIFVFTPVIDFANILQHTSYDEQGKFVFVNREITNDRLFVPVILPLDINLHGTHHLKPWIPHAKLYEVSKELTDEQKEKGHWIEQSIGEAFRDIFKKR